MPTDATFRWAAADDLAALARMTPDQPAAALQYRIAQQQVAVMEIDGTPVGCIRLDPIWNKLPFIGMIWIDAAHRRRGLGRQALMWIEERLVANGARVLFSSAEAIAPAAQAWHEAMGFQYCGTVDDMNGPGVGEIFYHKVLRPE